MSGDGTRQQNGPSRTAGGQPKHIEQEERKPVLIECAADRHIAVEFSDIFKELTKALQAVPAVKVDPDTFKSLAELIENLYAQKFLARRRNLKSNFLMFSVGAKDQMLPTKVGKTLPKREDLNDKELSVVYDMLQLMAAARFHLMTQKDWDLSLKEDFKFHLPVEINYDYFEPSLLTRFWESNPDREEVRAVLSDVADKMLVFHRGIGVAQDSGMFFQEKLDLLIEYTVAEPLKEYWERMKGYLPAFLLTLVEGKTDRSAELRRQYGQSWSRASDSNPTGASPGQLPNNHNANNLSEAGSPRPGSPKPEGNSLRRAGTGEAEEKAPAAEVPEAPQHRNRTIVERRSLRILMPTASQVLANAFKEIKLQEPLFKEVVVVYRTSPKGRAQAANAKNKTGFGKDNTTRLRHILNRRNIHIKYFHDIPMADIEAIFPDKIVHSKNIFKISMVVQAVIAFMAAIATMWQAGALSLSTIWSVLTLVGVRASQMYSRMQFERSRVMQEMVNILYDKMLDAQEGVLSMLLEDMAEQQLKEAVIAYTLLLAERGSMTEEALDEKCESFLESTYANNCKIDFAVEDALPQLFAWGLVKIDKSVHPRTFTAVPVDQACKALTDLWYKAFKEDHDSITTNELPLYNLLPGGENDLIRDGIRQSMRHYRSPSGLSDDDRYSTISEAVVVTQDGKTRTVARNKKDKGPIHKINKTLKGIFSDGKAPSKGTTPRPSDSAVGLGPPSSARPSTSGGHGAGAVPVSSTRSSSSGMVNGIPGRTASGGLAAPPQVSATKPTIQELAKEGEVAASK